MISCASCWVQGFICGTAETFLACRITFFAWQFANQKKTIGSSRSCEVALTTIYDPCRRHTFHCLCPGFTFGRSSLSLPPGSTYRRYYFCFRETIAAAEVVGLRWRNPFSDHDNRSCHWGLFDPPTFHWWAASLPYHSFGS